MKKPTTCSGKGRLDDKDEDAPQNSSSSPSAPSYSPTTVISSSTITSSAAASNIKPPVDHPVSLSNITSASKGGDATVNEAGLLSGHPGPLSMGGAGGGSPGSSAGNGSAVASGSFNISAPDGVASLVIGGQAVITNDVFTAKSIVTALGNTLNITAYNASTGLIRYTYTLVHNEIHPQDHGKNSVFDNITVSLTDRDVRNPDTTSSVLPIQIVDDVPKVNLALSRTAVTLSTSEAEMNGGASSVHSVSFAPAFQSSSVIGADGSVHGLTSAYSLSISKSGVSSGLKDTLTGQAIVLTLVSTANGNTVEGRTSTSHALDFTVKIDSSTGGVTLEQFRGIVQSLASNPDTHESVTLSQANLIQITRTDTMADADGDIASASAKLNIGTSLSFIDTGPTLNAALTAPVFSVLEHDLVTFGQALQTLSISNAITPLPNYGPDGPAAVSPITGGAYALAISSPNVNSGLIDLATHQAVLLSLANNVVTGYVTVSGSHVSVFSLTLDNNTSNLALKLFRPLYNDPITSDQIANLASPELIQLTRSYVLTDGDGDKQATTLSLNLGDKLHFSDDVPIAVSDPAISISEGGQTSLTSNLLLNDTLSADAPVALSISYDGGAHTAIATAGGITVPTALGGQIFINSAGNWNYVSPTNVNSDTNDNFTYKITDADGDSSSKVQVISVINTVSPFLAVNDGYGTGADSYSVYESALPTGSNADPRNPHPQAVSTAITGNVLSNDSLGSNSATIMSANFNGGMNATPDGNHVITVTSDHGTLVLYTQAYNGHDAGYFEYTLNSAVMDPGPGNNISDELFQYSLQDNGNANNISSANLKIHIVDDVPIVLLPTDTITVVEGAANFEGNVVNDNIIGADLPGSFVSFTYNGITQALSPDDPKGIIITTDLGGTFFASHSGEWNYTPPSSVINPGGADAIDNIAYLIQDGDSDATRGRISIHIQDGPAPVLLDDVGTVYERGLVDANYSATQIGKVLSNDNLGSDGAHINILEVSLNGTDYFPDAQTGLITINTAFSSLVLYTIGDKVHDAGYYEYSLTNPSDHQGSQVFTYSLQDWDGNSAQANLQINIVEDKPTANDDVTQTFTAGDSAHTGNVMTNDDTNSADQPVLLTEFIYSGISGPETAFVPNGGSFSAPTEAGGQLTVSSNGDWSYVPIGNMLASDIQDGFNYIIQDADGDTSIATQHFIIQPMTTPAFTANPESVMVSESGLPFGSNPDLQSTIGSGNVLINDDYGIHTTHITQMTYTDQYGVHSYSPDHDTGIIFAGSNDIGGGSLRLYTKSYYDSSTNTQYNPGDFEFKLTNPVDHPLNSDIVDKVFQYTVQDIGDQNLSAASTLTVHIQDDAPDAFYYPRSIEEGSNSLLHGALFSAPETIVGADAPASLVIYNHDVALTPDANNNVSFVTDLGGTYVINVSSGGWTYSPPASVQNIPNPDSVSGEVNDVFKYLLLDHDGDPAGNPYSYKEDVYITDGSPARAYSDSGTVSENALPGGSGGGSTVAIGNLLDNDVRGSDGAHLNISQIEYSSAFYAPVNNVITVDTGSENGILQVYSADVYNDQNVRIHSVGDYQYTLNGDASLPAETFNYTLADWDGNTTNADLTIAVQSGGGGLLGGGGGGLPGSGGFLMMPPVLIDLNGDGQTVSTTSAVSFEANNDGVKDTMQGWVNPEDGILVYDYNNTHNVTSVDQIAFSLYDQNAKTDLEGLKLAFDTNKDGIFDANDEKYTQFGIWQDKNSNGVVDPEEFHSLADLKIAAINLDSTNEVKAVGDNIIHGESSFVRTDGSTGVVSDVELAYKPGEGSSSSLTYQDVISPSNSSDVLQPLNVAQGSVQTTTATPSGTSSSTTSTAAPAGDPTVESAVIVPVVHHEQAA